MIYQQTRYIDVYIYYKNNVYVIIVVNNRDCVACLDCVNLRFNTN